MMTRKVTSPGKIGQLICQCVCTILLYVMPFDQANASQSNNNSDANRFKIAVSNAGIAMVGTEVQTRQRLPHLSSLRSNLSDELQKRILSIQPSHFELVSDALLDVTHGQTVAAGLLLEREWVLHRKVGDIHQIIVDVIANIVVFDFDSEEKSIIGTFPIDTSPCIQSYSSKPTPKETKQFFAQYINGKVCGLDSLVTLYLDRLEKLPIEQKFQGEVGFGTVTLNKNISELIPREYQTDEATFGQYLSSLMARSLSHRYGVSVIPYQVDTMVTKFAMNFTGGSNTDLFTLPEPEYIIQLHLKNLARKLTKKTMVAEQYFVGARVDVTVMDNFGDTIFQQSLAHAVVDEIPVSQAGSDLWRPYSRAITLLFDYFSTSISDPNDEWFKKQQLNPSGAKQLKAFKSALDDISF